MLVAGIEYVMVCANDGDRICTSIKQLLWFIYYRGLWYHLTRRLNPPVRHVTSLVVGGLPKCDAERNHASSTKHART